MDLGLAGKCALVTGSTSGIGEAIALELAQEGARVLVHGRREREAVRVVERIQARGGTAWSATGDLTDDDDARAIVDEALEQLTKVDIVVNNAGTYDFEATWSSLSADDWLARLDANVVSAVRVTRLLLDQLRQLGWGRIVNIGSTDATAPDAGLPEYAASKAALTNVGMSLARELQGSGVTANTVTPAFVLTPTVLSYMRTQAAQRSWGEMDDDELAQRASKELFGNPRGRWGHPDEVAFAVALVCSPRADWITGADIRLGDGGQ
jgi:NAD(P)-dependent dehydrogenase (short-subunit alcohol dehydrogenase family)